MSRGTLFRLLCKLLPNSIKKSLTEQLRELNSPHMVYGGYQNPGGDFCPQTRLSNTVFLYRPANIRLGNNVFVWHYTIFDGTAGLEVGEGTQIGAWVGIFTHSSHIAIRLLGRNYQEIPEDDKPAYGAAPVKIGRYVFVGSSAQILPGVTIGDYSLVVPNSVVKRNMPPFSVASGNPAKMIGDVRNLDLIELQKLSDDTIKQMIDPDYLDILRQFNA